jgi:hypothetical protein
MQNMKNTFIIACTLIFACACSARSLIEGAQTVRLLPSEPKSECKYLGDVIGKQTGGSLHSAAAVAQGAVNDLKNKTYKLGGNAVYMLDSKATSSGGALFGTSDGGIFSGGNLTSPSHTVMGIAYKCLSF